MGIFDNIIKRSHRSGAANKVSAACQSLFNHEHIIAADLDALIDMLLASGDAGIETFQLTLNHADNQRQEQILDMLGAMKSNAQPAPDPTEPSDSEKTIIALLACFLTDPQGMLSAKAITYLERYRTAATNVLLATLQHHHGRSRSHAARALANCDDQRAVPLLITALQNDDDARVRSDVAESLGKLADPLAIDGLIHALSDSNWLVRDSASNALAGFSDEIDQFSLLLQHENHQMRASAVSIIQRLKHQQVLPLLIAALDDPHLDVQCQAVDALSSYHKAIIPLLKLYHQSDIALRQHIASACNNIGINRVASQLSNHAINIRIAVINILAQLECTELLPLLADAWQHENETRARLQIIIAMAQLTAKAGKNSPDCAITTLIQATKEPDQNIIYHARKALQSLPHPLAEQFMQPLLQHSDIAINCPSCLEALQLKTPLTDKTYSCPHCHLSFAIHNGADDVLLLTPLTATIQGAVLPNRSVPWFDVLQIAPDADVATIKRSFRSLLKQYHPDKVDSLGTEFKLLAEEKTRLLTWALRSGLKQHGE